MGYSIYKGLKPNGEWKIGCDENYPNRPVQQKMTNYQMLEHHDDIYVASKREQELQKKHGVKVDTIPYHVTRKSCINGGIVTGNKNKESGFMSNLGKQYGAQNAFISCEKRHISSQDNIKNILEILPYYFKVKEAYEIAKDFGYTYVWVIKYLLTSKYVEKVGYNKYKNNLK